MIRAIRLLNLRRLRRQPLRAALAVIAVGAGVSLAVSVVVLTASINRSFAESGRRLAGPAPLRVVGALSRGGIDEATIPRVARVPGVAAAAPVIQAVTYAERPDGRSTTIVALGVDCRAQALLVGPDRASGVPASACATAGSSGLPLVVSDRLARQLGPSGVLRTDLGRLSVDHALVLPALDRINGGRVAIVGLTQAQRLFSRPHAVDVVYVSPRPGVTVADLRRELRDAVGPTNGVLAATDPPPGAGLVAMLFIPLFGLLSLFALGVGGVLIYNTMTLSLEERRKDLAVIGALGGPPRTVLVGALMEAGLLGLAGGGLGVIGGLGAAHPLTASLSDFTTSFAGLRVTVHATSVPIIAGLVLGTGLGVAAAWLPARRALRMDVAAELSDREQREDTAPRVGLRRGLVWTAIGIAGIVLCWIGQRRGALHPWQPPLGYLGLLVAVVGLLPAMGAFAPLLARAIVHNARPRRGPLRLALANLIRTPGRTAVMTVAVGAAVGCAFTISSSVRSFQDGINRGVTRGDAGLVEVSAKPPNNTLNVDANLSPSVLAALARVPGVARLERGAGLLTGHKNSGLIGVAGFDNGPGDLPLIAGSKDRAAFERGQVLVGAALARRQHLRPGSQVRLETPTGYVTLRVLGVWQDGNFTGDIVDMPLHLLESIWGAQPAEGVNLRPAPGVGVDELARRVRAAGLDPDLRVRTPSQLAHELASSVGSQVAPFWALQRGLLVMAFVAVLSTLLLVGVQRRRELGLLAAVGMRPTELRSMVLVEALIVGVLGSILGAIASGAWNVGFYYMNPVLFGWRDPFRLDFGSLVLYAPLVCLVVVAAAAWPAHRTARLEVLEALQYE